MEALTLAGTGEFEGGEKVVEPEGTCAPSKVCPLCISLLPPLLPSSGLTGDLRLFPGLKMLLILLLMPAPSISIIIGLFSGLGSCCCALALFTDCLRESARPAGVGPW